MAVLFSSFWESNDWSEWDSTSGAGTSVIDAVAALGGSNFGVRVTQGESGGIDTADSADMGVFSSFDEFTMKMLLDPNTFVDLNIIGFPVNKDIVKIFNDAQEICAITILDNSNGSGDNYVTGRVKNDSDSGLVVGSFVLTPVSSEVEVKIRVKKASSAIASDGELEIFLDNISKASRSDIDLFDNWPTSGTVTCELFTNSGTGGAYYIDAISIDSIVATMARFYQGAGSLSEKFTLPFPSIAPGAMTLDKALGTVVIGSRVPAGVVMVQAVNPYPTGTATDTGLPTGTSISSVKWI